MINGIDGFFYLTERVLICPFPGRLSSKNIDDRGSDDEAPQADDFLITQIAAYLNFKHKNHYLLYNLSEFKYDYSYFKSSVKLFFLLF